MSSIVELAEILERMEPDVRAARWDRVETQGRDACVRLAGPAAAKQIEAVSLQRFKSELRRGLERAVKSARELGAIAIYFEYDLDNDWEGQFFLCGEYVPQLELETADGGEDWASDWMEAIPGPVQRELTRIYAPQGGFAETPEQAGRTAFLIGRTVAAFGRAIEGLDTQGLAVCMAYHDQSGILRIRERPAAALRS
jgi:hypothetical protein